jgi:hypothetical protein
MMHGLGVWSIMSTGGFELVLFALIILAAFFVMTLSDGFIAHMLFSFLQVEYRFMSLLHAARGSLVMCDGGYSSDPVFLVLQHDVSVSSCFLFLT